MIAGVRAYSPIRCFRQELDFFIFCSLQSSGGCFYEHEFDIIWGVNGGRGGVSPGRLGGWQLSHNHLGQKVLW